MQYTHQRRSAGGHDPVAYPDLLQGLPDLLIGIDSDGVIVYASASSRNLLGRPPGALVGRWAWEYVTPEDRRMSATWLTHAATSGGAPPLRHHLLHADGSSRLFETRVGRTPSGRYTGRLVAISRDVSAQSAVDRQIESMGELWAAVCNRVSDGIVLISEDGTVLSANAAAERLLCRSVDQLAGAEIDAVLRLQGGAHPGEFPWWRSRHPVVAEIADDRTPPELLVEPIRSDAETDAFTLLIRAADPAPVPTRAEPPDTSLSPREYAVLRLLSEGSDVRAIAGDLGISVHTARHYMKTLLKKLGAHTQVQAVLIAIRTGLLDLS